jgi:hypothetical protein
MEFIYSDLIFFPSLDSKRAKFDVNVTDTFNNCVVTEWKSFVQTKKTRKKNTRAERDESGGETAGLIGMTLWNEPALGN